MFVSQHRWHGLETRDTGHRSQRFVFLASRRLGGSTFFSASPQSILCLVGSTDPRVASPLTKEPTCFAPPFFPSSVFSPHPSSPGSGQAAGHLLGRHRGRRRTLIVTPAGESVLIDAGNPGERDPRPHRRSRRNVAGLKQIDNLVVTHYHVDHFGGAAELSTLIPIRNVYDNGNFASGREKPDGGVSRLQGRQARSSSTPATRSR